MAWPVALVVLGLTPFLALMLPHDWRPDATRRAHAWGCGLVCTALQLVAGVAGPILDSFFVHAGMDRKQVVATKAAIQTFSHVLKIVYFGSLIAVGGGSVGSTVILLAAGFAVLGTNLSRVVLDAMSDAQFTRWTRRIVLTTAAIYLAQGLWLLRETAA